MQPFICNSQVGLQEALSVPRVTPACPPLISGVAAAEVSMGARALTDNEVTPQACAGYVSVSGSGSPKCGELSTLELSAHPMGTGRKPMSPPPTHRWTILEGMWNLLRGLRRTKPPLPTAVTVTRPVIGFGSFSNCPRCPTLASWNPLHAENRPKAGPFLRLCF